MQRMRVDLPAPLGPRMTRNSPSLTSMLTSRSAMIPPGYVLESPRIEIMRSVDSTPNVCGRQIDHGHHAQDHQQDETRLPPLEQADAGDQLEPQAARPHHAEHGGRAHSHLEPVEAVGHELRDDLGEDREEDHLEPPCAGGLE